MDSTAEIRVAARAFAQEVLRPNAAKFDSTYELPVDSLAAMHDTGLLATCVPEALGGNGSNPLMGVNPAPHLAIMEEFARIDMATGHCYQVHAHACMLIDAVASAEDKQRYLRPVVESGALFSWTGSEQGRTDQFVLQAKATPVDGGYLLNGTKHFATLAPLASWNIIAVGLDTVEPGSDSYMLVMVPAGAKGMDLNSDWWRPTGMRATVSPIIKLSNVFVPEQDVLLGPGGYPAFMKKDNGWKLHLSFTASFVGAAQGMLDFALDYIGGAGRTHSARNKQLLGEVSSRIDGARALLYESVATIDSPEAVDKSLQARFLAFETAQRMIPEILEVVGSRALFENFPLERMIRDIHLQSTHSKQGVLAETLGSRMLDDDYDLSKQT